ncbi:MAG TPA: NAD(P)H-dependent oxidoreductase [Candidatus Angelobacter sp.]|nr:NAD(P)H-dependent oxidoreductase [Candidatus Angelobacter sp.]
MKVLHIQSSPRGESSNSIALTNAFIDACQSRDNSLVIDTLNVWNENLPEFDSEAIGAKYKAVKNESMTKRESAVWRQVQALIQRFQRADRIVLGSPMWNFAPPYKLKQLIDLVAQRRYLFSYDGKQYGPMLNVAKAVAVYTRGSASWKILRSRPASTIRLRISTFGWSSLEFRSCEALLSIMPGMRVPRSRREALRMVRPD